MLTQRFLQLNLLGAEWVNWLLVAMSLAAAAVTADRVLLYWRTREGFARLRTGLQERLRRGAAALSSGAADRASYARFRRPATPGRIMTVGGRTDDRTISVKVENR